MKRAAFGLYAASLVLGLGLGGFAAQAGAAEPTLSEDQFEHAKKLYFQRCAGCHGVLRKGATGKNLEPKNMRKKGQKKLEKILTFGTEGGMNNFDDIFTKEEIKLLATYIQMEPPIPPELGLAEMKKRWKTVVCPRLLISNTSTSCSHARASDG